MLEKIINDVCDWHKETFPDITVGGQLKKLEEELKEYYDCYDYSELADVLICSIVLWRRFKCHIGHAVYVYAKQIVSATHANMIVAEKMKINKARKWQKVEGVWRHIDE